MKKILVIFFLIASVIIVNAATLLPNGKQQFFDASGNPLVGGQVFFYVPLTTTPKDTWQDSGQTTLNTNPVILDGAGEAVIYGSGTYRQLVKDALGNIIWDQLTSDTSASSINFATAVGGTANNITVTVPSFTSGNGQIVAFLAIGTNSGSATINGITVVKDTPSGPLNLTGAEITTGNMINAQYDAANNQFHLVGNDLASVIIVGGTINNTTIGATTPATGKFTSVEVTGSSPPPNGMYLPSAVTTITNNAGLTAVGFSATASAVNNFLIGSVATAANPFISATGSDTNIGMTLTTKGTGQYNFQSNNFGRTAFQIFDVVSAVNWLAANNSVTGTGPSLSALGSDTNLNLVFVPKGTGVLQCALCNTNTTTGTANLIISAAGLIQKTTSSIKFKKEVVTYDRGIEDVMKLRSVYFRSKIPTDNQRRQVGLIAEEVQKTGFDEFVEHNNAEKPNEATGVQYTAMNALFINALKDLKNDNDNLRKRILVLERNSKGAKR